MWPLNQIKLRHIIAFAVFVAITVPLLYFVTVNSNEYKEAVRFITNDPKLADSIGKVRSITLRFWDGYESSGYSAYYTFGVISDRGKFIVDIHLREIHDKWTVEKVNVR